MCSSDLCGVCLKIMEKIGKGKDKKHAGKLASNPEDNTPYITRQI